MYDHVQPYLTVLTPHIPIKYCINVLFKNFLQHLVLFLWRYSLLLRPKYYCPATCETKDRIMRKAFHFLNFFLKNFFISIRTNIDQFQCSVTFYIQTSHLICCGNRMIHLYMKCNTGLKWVKQHIYVEKLGEQ